MGPLDVLNNAIREEFGPAKGPPQEVPFERRVELQAVAVEVGRVIRAKTKPHEFELLSRMLTDLFHGAKGIDM